MFRVTGTAALGMAVLLSACASSSGGADAEVLDPDLPMACFDIDNRQGGAGTMERVYLIDADRRPKEGVSYRYTGYNRMGDGVRLGEARQGKVTRFCTQNIQLPGRYFLRVELASADNFDPATQNSSAGWAASRTPRMIETDDVVVEAGDLWIWDVRRDRWDCRANSAFPTGDC